MPLRLTVLRHAKSSWDDPALDDFERPLNERGERDAPRIGAWLATRTPLPDMIRCSSAVRTRATLALIKPHLGKGARVRTDKALYLAEAETLLTIVRATAGDVRHLMLIGHNPGLEDLVRSLIGVGSPELRQAIEAKFPTAAVAIMSFETERWADVGPGLGQLIDFMTPRRLA